MCYQITRCRSSTYFGKLDLTCIPARVFVNCSVVVRVVLLGLYAGVVYVWCFLFGLLEVLFYLLSVCMHIIVFF